MHSVVLCPLAKSLSSTGRLLSASVRDPCLRVITDWEKPAMLPRSHQMSMFPPTAKTWLRPGPAVG